MEDYKKKFEDALENIKKIKAANKGNKELIDFIEYNYPELKESEDERIRKGLINHLEILRGWTLGDPLPIKVKEHYDAWIAWLEKQGGHKPVRLEKQCKQKLADKVEPKFKVGDIIINEYGFILQIDGIDNNMYVYHIFDDNWPLKYDITKTEESCHLWTIQDAKKGDILQANKCTLIFDSLTKDIDGNTVISSWYFCDTNIFYGMGPSRPDLWYTKGVVPATKEQRDLLFSKMKEAGYEWDSEKKKLRKIEQKFTEKYKTCDWLWNYGSIGLTKEHIKRLNNAINILESLHEYTDANYLKEIKDKLLEDIPNIEKINNDDFKELKKIEQKSDWRVDLEKEIEEYVSDKGLKDYGFLIPSIAQHFFELRLKAQKGEEVVL